MSPKSHIQVISALMSCICFVRVLYGLYNFILFQIKLMQNKNQEFIYLIYISVHGFCTGINLDNLLLYFFPIPEARLSSTSKSYSVIPK